MGPAARRARRPARLAVVAAMLVVSACGSAPPRSSVPAGTSQPDQFLFDKGQAAL
jgi:hypothetical protein